MSKLTETYGNKKDGELIPAKTWNGLVAMLDDISAGLAGRIDSLDASIKTVLDQVTKTQKKIEEVAAQADATAARVTFLYGQNYRLTLKTANARYPVGSPGLVIARLTDLTGAPMKFEEATGRPWVDFITTWGKFSPAKGYEASSRGDVGDRSMSVQADASGTAQVLLIAEQIEEVSTDHQAQIHQVMQSRVGPDGKMIAERILEAATPLEVKNAGVFTAISDHYENAGGGIRAFADSYFLKNSVRLTNRVQLNLPPQWKDYLSTVFAFVKDDLDSTTADASRGASSLQVVFRDWVQSWIHHGFLADLDTARFSFKERIIAKVSDDHMTSARLIKDEVATFVKDAGVLGRQRNFKAMREVFNSLTVPGKPYIPALAVTLRDAVTLQQSLDLTSGAISGESGMPLVFDTFTGTSVDAYAAAAGVKSELEQKLFVLEQKVTTVDGRMSKVDSDFSTIKGRVDKHEGQFGEMTSINAKVSTIQNQVSALQNFKVLDVPVDIENIKKDIKTLQLNR